MRRLISWIALTALVGCSSDDVVEYYTPGHVDVHQVAIDRDGRMTVDYRATAETLWYCPGADVVREGDALVLRFRRLWYRDEAQPDATPIRRGQEDRIEVTSVGDVRRVFVADEAAVNEVWRDGAFVDGR